MKPHDLGGTHPGKGFFIPRKPLPSVTREDGSAPAVHAAFYLWQLGGDELLGPGVDFVELIIR